MKKREKNEDKTVSRLLGVKPDANEAYRIER